MPTSDDNDVERVKLSLKTEKEQEQLIQGKIMKLEADQAMLRTKLRENKQLYKQCAIEYKYTREQYVASEQTRLELHEKLVASCTQVDKLRQDLPRIQTRYNRIIRRQTIAALLETQQEDQRLLDDTDTFIDYIFTEMTRNSEICRCSPKLIAEGTNQIDANQVMLDNFKDELTKQIKVVEKFKHTQRHVIFENAMLKRFGYLLIC
tara:strand:+ start:76 stop:693 length:618 start_codon:yes stop_codon:yes gene_type:complete